MKLSMLDRALHKDQLIGRHFIKAESNRREKLAKFREQFNRGSIQNRIQTARDLQGKAAYNVADEDGFLIVPKPAYPELDGMIKKAQEIVANNDLEALRRNSKDQLLTGLLKKEWLDYDSPFVQFVLREEIASSVANYLGMMPVITKIDVWYSKASPELSNSQLHHCDFESIRQLKLFVYASDVTEDNGPLVVMKASDSEKVRNQIHYRYGQKIKDEVIDPIVPPSQQLKALGGPGTMIFGDTSRCFHYGSRVNDDQQSRIVILYQFLRPQSFLMPIKFINNSPYSDFSRPNLPTYQRQLFGAE
ncbi:MAG: hypothetical protein KDC34_03935 [Saprospiraceae bacterium]|nr:hypothetical protein [Saprospiraceae bacterium]